MTKLSQLSLCIGVSCARDGAWCVRGGGACWRCSRGLMADGLRVFAIWFWGEDISLALGVVASFIVRGGQLDVLAASDPPAQRQSRRQMDRSGPPAWVADCGWPLAVFSMNFRIMLQVRFWFIWRWAPSFHAVAKALGGCTVPLMHLAITLAQFAVRVAAYWPAAQVMFVVCQGRKLCASLGRFWGLEHWPFSPWRYP